MMLPEPYPDVPGLWPELRHDARLSGHQPLAGAITRPAVAWRQYLGGPHFDARLVASGRRSDLLLPFGGCLHRYDGRGTLLWTSPALGIESIVGVEDLDADGALEIVASNGKSVFVLAASSGRVLWQEYLGPPFAGGFMHTGARLHRFAGFGAGWQLAVGLLSSKEVVVYDFTPGVASPDRRHILWMDDFFHPSLIAADLDGDGRDELVVTKLSSVYVFDPHEGRSIGECRWSSGGTPKRNYGMLEAIDVDGDRALDLVVISDRVSRHIAVVGNDGTGALANRWDRFLEHIYESDETELRFTTSSVVDLDRDGRPEIVVSIFNEHRDGRWWLEVIDAATGAVRLREPDLYLRGIDRERPDLAPLLLVSRETTRVPAERARVAILEWEAGGLVERWSHERASFVGRFAEPRAGRALFRTDLPPADDAWIVWLDGEPLVAVLCDEGLGMLDVRHGVPSFRVLPESGDVVAILAVGDLDGDDRDELVLADLHGGITLMQGDGTVIASLRGGMRLRPGTGPYYMAKPMSSPVVAADASGRYCAVPDAGAAVHVLRWDDSLGMPELTARIPLRGRIGPEEAFHAVTIARLDDRAVIVGARVGDGAAAIEIVATDGALVTRLEVPSLPASPVTPLARTSIHDYALIDGPGAPRLVVSGFRSPSMNSELTLAISEAGSEQWRLQPIEMPGHALGPGPWNAMSIEGRVDAATLHFLAKDTLVALDAVTGEHVAPPLQLRPFNTAELRRRGLTMDDFSAYGSVVPLDVDGETLRLLIASYGGHGAVTLDGHARWWQAAPLSTLTGGFGGIADIDGDGRLELLVSESSGDLVCLNALDGIERWRLHLGLVATGMASCDIDGCGRAEIIVATREGALLAVGAASNGSGLVRWRLDLGSTLGPPTIADFDGDGASEILVVAGDGYLYGVAASAALS